MPMESRPWRRVAPTSRRPLGPRAMAAMRAAQPPKPRRHRSGTPQLPPSMTDHRHRPPRTLTGNHQLRASLRASLEAAARPSLPPAPPPLTAVTLILASAGLGTGAAHLTRQLTPHRTTTRGTAGANLRASAAARLLHGVPRCRRQAKPARPAAASNEVATAPTLLPSPLPSSRRPLDSPSVDPPPPALRSPNPLLFHHSPRCSLLHYLPSPHVLHAFVLSFGIPPRLVVIFRPRLAGSTGLTELLPRHGVVAPWQLSGTARPAPLRPFQPRWHLSLTAPGVVSSLSRWMAASADLDAPLGWSRPALEP